MWKSPHWATAAVPTVTTWNKETVAAFFEPKTCTSTEEERAAQFQKANQKHVAAVEVVVRPKMSKAEEAAKQADIRHSFQVAAAAEKDPPLTSSAAASADPALELSSSAPRASLEEELEKMMDEAEEDQKLLESPKPTKTRAPKANAKAKAKMDKDGREKVGADADAKTKTKAKTTTGKAANFQSSGSGKGKGGSNGSGGRGRGNGNGNNFRKQQK